MTLSGAGRGGPQGPFNATRPPAKEGGIHCNGAAPNDDAKRAFPATKNAEFPGRIASVRYVPAIWYEGLLFPHPAVYKKILLDVYTWTRV